MNQRVVYFGGTTVMSPRSDEIGKCAGGECFEGE